MPNHDLDEDVDLAVLWQSLHMGHEIWPGQAAWMERHGIANQAGLDAYRDAKLKVENEAKGFTPDGKLIKDLKTNPASLGPLFEGVE